MQNSSQSQDSLVDCKKETIKKSIDSICKYQKSYVKNSLSNLLENSPKNAEIICRYIIAEQNEINIKELTKEGKIKTLIDITKFSGYKDLDELTKDHFMLYGKNAIDVDYDSIGTCPFCNSRIDEFNFCACGGNMGAD